MEQNKKVIVIALFVSFVFALTAFTGYMTVRAERKAWKEEKVTLINGLNQALEIIDKRFLVIENGLTQSMPVIEQSFTALDERIKKLESAESPPVAP